MGYISIRFLFAICFWEKKNDKKNVIILFLKYILSHKLWILLVIISFWFCQLRNLILCSLNIFFGIKNYFQERCYYFLFFSFVSWIALLYLIFYKILKKKMIILKSIHMTFFSEEKARVRREASDANVLEMGEIQRSNGRFPVMYLFFK